MKPTIEQIEGWKNRYSIDPGMDYFVDRAYAAGREQALEEAAKVCADLTISGGDNASYCWGAGDCEKAIRALKEKANEHAPIPG